MPALILHAASPCWVPDSPDSLLRVLLDSGLIAPCNAAESAFKELPAGAEFLRLVMLLGCSPQVALAAASARDGQPLCSLTLAVRPRVEFLEAIRRPPARCPHCRAAVAGCEPQAFDSQYTCPDCGQASLASALDWRQAAGFGRCFIHINGIYPHEAVPADSLLAILSQCSGDHWRFFYT
jgi:hypothetical protein